MADVAAEPPYGLTLPLLTDSQGVKFGKSMGNAVWLDAALTSPYDLYQYFLRTDDALAEQLVRFYTFWDDDALAQLVTVHRVRPSAARLPRRTTNGPRAAVLIPARVCACVRAIAYPPRPIQHNGAPKPRWPSTWWSSCTEVN